jgi:O-antigen biosynthesis protein
MRMRISVVVPTFNRKNILRQCLTALLAQDYADYEVIVVDDGSTDGTGDMLAAEFPRVRYFRQVNQGQAVARNTGVQAAEGEIVAFTDDDNLVPSDWLSRHADGYRRYPEVSGVAGRMEPPEEVWRKNVFARHELWMTFYAYGLTPDRPEYVADGLGAPAATNNVSYRRSALLEVGGFSRKPSRLVVGEERELRERLCAHGYTHYLYLPVKVLHLRRYAWKGFLTQTLEAGVGVRQHHRRRAQERNTLVETERVKRGRFAGLHQAIAQRDVKLVVVLVTERIIYAIGRLLPDQITARLIRAISKL